MREDGGPAFPCSNEQLTYGNHMVGDAHPGMTLRDKIAIEALGGMLAHSTRYRPREGASADWHVAIAEEAYQIADAMLAERFKP